MKIAYHIPFFSLFLLGACSKNIGDQKINRDNPTSYVLVKEERTGPSTNGETMFFSYNNNNLVSTIKRVQWGSYSSNNTTTKWYDTAYYNFEYVNGVVKKHSIREGGSNGYFIYDYNADNLPVLRTCYTPYIAYDSFTGISRPDSNKQYSLYKYDNRKNLIERTDSGNGKVNLRFEFSYNENNDMTSAVMFYINAQPQQKLKYEWAGFDGKVNFIKAVNGLPPTFVWDNNYHSYSSSSPGNYMAESYFLPVNINEPFGTPVHTNYTYTYNDEGLPVKMTYGVWTVTFEYRKM